MKNRGLGPHSRRHRLGYLDGRTFEGKLYRQFREDLIKHVGREPSVAEIAIIERCAWIQLRCSMMDTKVSTGDFTEQDSHVYLAWAGCLGRLLKTLGLKAPPARTPTLDDYWAARMDAGEDEADAA